VKALNAVAGLVAAALLIFSVPLLAAIQLVPVASALSQPVFVGHAGDSTGRLFIVERAGVIKVLQPGSSTPTIFLDINGLVVDGGSEQGLLGLAFHPLYEFNGRFFVFYTRTGGELTIAEYHVSANPDVADPSSAEILLTIPHPSNLNHNGGMLAFGPDGFLYIGVGDGGSGNDPPNNAQNLDVLLGKILRIDVNFPEATYVIPASNPFVGGTGTRDEIFAYGFRNPWRFAFDRDSGQLWVADVGQGLREEVDTPIVSGGNYGWRVYEGTLCTNLDPALCGAPGFIPPLFDYTHSGGRCSITGGYVYRGNGGAVADGTYLYGDFCTGELFGWNGAQTVLLDTALNISSFGEDEAGEVYVVGLGGVMTGTVHRIASTTPSCTYAIAPTSQSFGAGGGSSTISVTAGTGCGWTAAPNASWLHVTSGSSGSGNGSVGYSVDANTLSSPRSGTLTVASQMFTVNQAAAPVSCTYTIAPTRATFASAGGAGSVTVTTGAGCPWTAASADTWITVTGGASGNGTGTVTYSVAPYSGRQGVRNGRIIIADLAFTVKQSK
jgi:glucose/arabinose dehydrogenase